MTAASTMLRAVRYTTHLCNLPLGYSMLVSDLKRIILARPVCALSKANPLRDHMLPCHTAGDLTAT